MKEVTRVHLAKISYDIEVDAKKKLEKYVRSLESYTNDTDVLEDIEIRMTELLAERDVKAGGVIGSEDVDFIRTQLGEPHEFADDSGDIAVGVEPKPGTRRYYRNKDNAVLGGVLGGIATYFGFNPLWARLVFILIFLMSWGTAAIVYIVLWVAVPPAKTAAEKLQLAGKPTTLASIRELNDEAPSENKTALRVQKVISIVFGVGFILAALLSLLLTVWGAVGISWGTSDNSPLSGLVPWDQSFAVWTIYGLVILSGLLLTALFSVVAYATLARTVTKRLGIAMIGITIAGIVAFSTAIGMGFYESYQANNRVQSAVKEYRVDLPAGFADVKTLTASSSIVSIGYGDYSDLSIEYVVDEGRPRYVLESLPGVKPQISIDGTNAKVSLPIKNSEAREFRNFQPRLTIYGPALDAIVSEKAHLNYTGKIQDSIDIRSLERSSVSVSGSYQTANVYTAGFVDLDDATVHNLTIETNVAGGLNAGVVASLKINQPAACPSHGRGYDSGSSKVVVRGVSSGKVDYNGSEVNAVTKSGICSLLIIGLEEDYYEDNNRGDY